MDHQTMQTTILGSGTSTGVPRIHCRCSVCRSKNPKNHRLRASIWVQSQNTSILVDASPDLRQQAMKAKIPRFDAVFLTHPHNDHVGGLDDLRSYNYSQGEEIPLYAHQWTQTELKRRYHYIFGKRRKQEGGGIPLLKLHPIHKKYYRKKIKIKELQITPIPYQHGSEETLGFRINDIAYIPDCSYIPPASLNSLQGLEVLILDCLRIDAHRTHLNFDEAMKYIDRLRPKKTVLTHLGHDFDYDKWSKMLPKKIRLAYDGLKIRSSF